MKRFFFVAAGLCLMYACDNGAVKSESELMRERDSLMQVIAEKDYELDDIMGMFNEVQDGFRRISEAEGRVTVLDGNPEMASTKTLIHENLQYIEETMTQNRDLIARLQKKLEESSYKSKKLKATIKSLEEKMTEQEGKIQELQVQLAEKNLLIIEQNESIKNLKGDVENLKAENKTKEQIVGEQEKKLNTAWFVFGTKAELKEQNILRDGDVLRTADFNTNYFTEVDIRYDKEIRLYSKSAKILTNHPAGSYALTRDAKEQYVLKIVNYEKFWSVSRYLVVQVK
ncbi:MAG: hypothetical protein II222_03785 [Paraprevotella sp.]|nr:hypothetical protein [Paraprevotella sp.]